MGNRCSIQQSEESNSWLVLKIDCIDCSVLSGPPCITQMLNWSHSYIFKSHCMQVIFKGTMTSGGQVIAVDNVVLSDGRMYASKLCFMWFPGPHSHRTRGYLCSFPITRTPLSREKDIQGYTPLSRVLVTIGNYKKSTPFSWFSREIFPRLRPKIPPFPRKWECACGPLCIRVGGGGGGGAMWFFFLVKKKKRLLRRTLTRLDVIRILTDCPRRRRRGGGGGGRGGGAVPPHTHTIFAECKNSGKFGHFFVCLFLLVN